nr:uncharacterized protein LOC127487529 isoform X20 [Oryctolagus cuniculus]XP_051689312.1 uncharacterized protein LOC127487529 isoform X20 [Oryctolagus cuniculus]XP_051689313.1 uncharacterized protein LOC127487529 isoform X20 [Oryctolagus cuniculus]
MGSDSPGEQCHRTALGEQVHTGQPWRAVSQDSPGRAMSQDSPGEQVHMGQPWESRCTQDSPGEQCHRTALESRCSQDSPGEQCHGTALESRCTQDSPGRAGAHRTALGEQVHMGQPWESSVTGQPWESRCTQDSPGRAGAHRTALESRCTQDSPGRAVSRDSPGEQVHTFYPCITAECRVTQPSTVAGAEASCLKEEMLRFLPQGVTLFYKCLGKNRGRRLILCVWHRHPIQVPVLVSVAPLLVQPSAVAREGSGGWPSAWALHPRGRPGGSTWLLASDLRSAGHCSQLGSEPTEGRPFSLFLSLSVILPVK